MTEDNFILLVLPPVPTTGLTSADVGALTERVREQMLKVLLELSGDSPSVDMSTSKAETIASPSVPAQAPVQAVPTAIVEQPTLTAPRTTTHVVAPSESSENGTTDDDDMVIVGRPAAK